MEIELELLKRFFIRGDTLKSTSYPMPGIKQLDLNGQQLPPISRVRRGFKLLTHVPAGTEDFTGILNRFFAMKSVDVIQRGH